MGLLGVGEDSGVPQRLEGTERRGSAQVWPQALSPWAEWEYSVPCGWPVTTRSARCPRTKQSLPLRRDDPSVKARQEDFVAQSRTESCEWVSLPFPCSPLSLGVA